MASKTAQVENRQVSLHIEPLDASMPRQSEMINKISPEVWQTIFSFLNRSDFLPASLTCKHWKVQMESNFVWSNFFKSKVYFVEKLSFPSWKVAALNYAHKKERVKSETSSHQEVHFLRWGKEINPSGNVISYEEDGLQFNDFLEHERMIVATHNGLKVLKLNDNQITEESQLDKSNYSYRLGKNIYYHRYLISKDYDSATLESIDLNSPKSRFTWSLSKASRKVKESGHNTIISLNKDQEIICYNLETGEQKPLSNEKLHMWKSISKELLLLIFKNGLVQIRNLTNGSSVTINEPIENGNIIKADSARNYVILFYENATHLEFTAKFINLENGETYLIEKERDNLQCVDCFFSEETNSLILSYGKLKKKYKVVDLKTKLVSHQFELNTPCRQWILCSDSYFLYLDRDGVFKIYKLDQKTEILPASSEKSEKTFVRKEVFGKDLLIWVDEECPINDYDDDDYYDDQTVLKLRCYVFNPENLTLDPIQKGSVYTNERNCFVMTPSGNHILFNKETSTVILCSDNDDELSIFYSKAKNQVIIGESFGDYDYHDSDDDDDDDYEPKTFSLQIYNIEKKEYVTLVSNDKGQLSLTAVTSFEERRSKRLYSEMQGQVSQIYNVGSKICAFVYSWDGSGKSHIIEIDQNLVVTKTELAKGVYWNNFIEGKRLITANGAIHSFNGGISNIDPLLKNHPNVELLNDRVVITSKGSIDLFRL